MVGQGTAGVAGGGAGEDVGEVCMGGLGGVHVAVGWAPELGVGADTRVGCKGGCCLHGMQEGQARVKVWVRHGGIKEQGGRGEPRLVEQGEDVWGGAMKAASGHTQTHAHMRTRSHAHTHTKHTHNTHAHAHLHTHNAHKNTLMHT